MIPALLDLARLSDRPDAYHNEVIATVDDHVVRLAIMTGAYFWHRHPNSDEFFQCVEGELEIAFDDGTIVLAPGQVTTVPAGMVHRTRSLSARTVNLTIERADMITVRIDRDEGVGDPLARPASATVDGA